MDFMTWCSLAILKHEIGDVISAEAVTCMERCSEKKIQRKETGNFAIGTCAELHARSALSRGKTVGAN